MQCPRHQILRSVGRALHELAQQDDISLPDVRQRREGVHARSDSLGRVLKLRLLGNIAETV